MTPEQIKQWNDYACVPRCLIKLAEMKGNSITRDEFVARFKEVFVDPDKRLGLISDEGFDKVFKSLSLAKEVRQSNDYSMVEKAFNNKMRKVLVLSEINLDPAEANEIKHCSVLMKIDLDGFTIWTPCQTGADESVELKKKFWAEKKCSGLLFF